jgi:hypothetical protein
MLQTDTCSIIYLISKLCEILSRVSSPHFDELIKIIIIFYFPVPITSMQMLLMLGFFLIYIYTKNNKFNFYFWNTRTLLHGSQGYLEFTQILFKYWGLVPNRIKFYSSLCIQTLLYGLFFSWLIMTHNLSKFF